MIQNTSHAAEGHGSLLVLALLTLIAGAAAGLVGAIFRLTLQQADRLRDALIAWAQGEKLAGFLFVVATCAAAALIAAWLVRRFSPQASGSGIAQVEAVLNEEILQPPFHLIWVKFCGGVLAIGSGLALGREGPSVQMEASVAHLVGKVCDGSILRRLIGLTSWLSRLTPK
jgi:chloride channel protein, CIC family